MALDGRLQILADHTPLITPIEVGSIEVQSGGEKRTLFNSEGFMEVHSEGVIVYIQAGEWPEEIDARRAEEARRRAEELLRQRQSISEYRQSKIALARAMARLQVTKAKTK